YAYHCHVPGYPWAAISTSQLSEKFKAVQSSSRTPVASLLVGLILGAGIAIGISELRTPSEPQASEHSVGASGLRWFDVVVGSGPAAQAGDTVSIAYIGWLMDGTRLSSADPAAPFVFTLGHGEV